jgi:uncharacterized OsmC-like protein
MRAIEVRHERGDRLRIRIRDHDVVTDQPLGDGGTDEGPSPTELWVAALAACVVFYAERFLVRHGLPLDGLAATCVWRLAEDRPARVGAIGVTLEVPAGVPAERLERLRAVVERCTVHNSLATPPEVRIDLAPLETAGAA